MPKRYRVIDLETADALRKAGKTHAQIAKRFKVTASAVQDLLRRHGRITVKPHACSACRARGLLIHGHRANQCPGAA